MSRRALLGGLAAVLALVLILVLSRAEEDRYGRPPLDPRGTGPRGLAALVDLLRAEGATVRLGGQPGPGDDVVLQVVDTLGGEPAARLRRWVAGGGTLVTTDPHGALAPRGHPGPYQPVGAPGACRVDAAAGLDPLVPALPALFAPDPAASTCFTAPDGAARLAVRALGAGRVAALSDPEPLVNGNLARGGNAGLAAALLVPHDGARVRVLDPHRFLGDADHVGDGTVWSALPRRGREAAAQLVVAFLVWALVRGRRLGRPVPEELPVPLPASDLVLATGHLLDRNGSAADAAARLRHRARRDLGVALGLGPDPDPAALVEALVTHARVDRARAEAALIAPVVDDHGLVLTSTHLDRLREDIRP